MHLQPDSLLQNRYRIVGLIAQGGMGAVYQAVDTRLGNTVALKQTLMADPQLRMAFEGEARLLAALHHPALAVVVPGWTVQVAEVLRGRSAWNALYAANNQNDPVSEGFEYYLVKLRVEPTFSGEGRRCRCCLRRTSLTIRQAKAWNTYWCGCERAISA